MRRIVSKNPKTQKILQFLVRHYNLTNAIIAQLVERSHGKAEVSGSNPDDGSRKINYTIAQHTQ